MLSCGILGIEQAEKTALLKTSQPDSVPRTGDLKSGVKSFPVHGARHLRWVLGDDEKRKRSW
jgi:hypothetical protein